MGFKRADRVADLLMAEISDILLRQVGDPRLKGVTITRVKVTDDLRLARIFFVEMGKESCTPEVKACLEKAISFVKRELGKRLKLRYVPDIIFKLDESFEYGSHIDRILASIKQEEGNDVE